MHRTTIRLPGPLKRAAARLARQRSISLGKLVRQALEREIRRTQGPHAGPRFAFAEFTDKHGATDVSARIDDYLYGASHH